jgi:kinesin family protein 20
LEQNELKTDAKIDMLHQAGFFGSPEEPPYDSNESESEKESVELSLRGEHLAVGFPVDVLDF